MSSGQWEVVTRSKKDKGPKKLSKAEKKVFIENAPKVEDILPLSQVKSLYATLSNNNKENAKPKESPKKQQAQQQTAAQQPKKQTVKKKNESKQEVKKPKYAKSIESGLHEIDINDIKELIEIGKQRFPQAPLVWLKDLALLLNTKTNVENPNPTFSNKPVGYPLNIVPDVIKKHIEQTLQDVGPNICQTFYEICLSAIAFEMSKGAPVIGYKICIQILTKINALYALNSKEKFINLRNSYQNRQPIGLSLLWCLNQVLDKNFDIGLKVIQEMMLDMIEMKNYTKYIINCIKTFLYKKWPAGTCSFDNFIYLYDLINGSGLQQQHMNMNITKEYRKDLQSSCNSSLLQSLIFDDRPNGKYSILFELLIKKIQQYNTTTTTAYNTDLIKIDLLDITLKCLLKESTACLMVWKDLYAKNITASASLLALIKSKWYKVHNTIDKKQFINLLYTFNNHNKVLIQNKKKEDSIHEVERLSKILIDKMTVPKTFPWKKFLLLLIISSITAFIVYDSNEHGGFAKSDTKKFLKETGIWAHGQTALKQTIIVSKKAVKWTQENGHVYYGHAKEFLLPYVELVHSLLIVAKNAYFEILELIMLRIPTVVAIIESYAPGLVDKLVEVSHYVGNLVVQYYGIVREYLITKVFVGQLSPDNLQKATLEALNTTQQYATRYYDWFYEMISNFD